MEGTPAEDGSRILTALGAAIREHRLQAVIADSRPERAQDQRIILAKRCFMAGLFQLCCS